MIDGGALSSCRKTAETAFVYIGLVIGAGFASGREILEYFNFASQTDLTGIVLAAMFFALISYITMSLSDRYGSATFGEFIDETAGRFAAAVKVLLFLYMFCGFFVMLSGSGTLISEIFSVSGKVGIFLLAAVCFVVFVFDIRGIVAVNTVMVPLMIAGIVFLCLSAALYGEVQTFFGGTVPRRNPIVSALCYSSYNTITAGAVLVPLSMRISRRDMAKSAVLSGSILGILIFSVWTVLNIYFADIFEADMPLLEIAEMQGGVYEAVYSAVLFMSLCTTAISHGFGILAELKARSFWGRAVCAGGLCLLAVPFAELGFSELIAYLYTAFGVLGFVWLAVIVRSFAVRK